MTNTLRSFRAIITWNKEFLSKVEVIEKSSFFACNLKFLLIEDIWSVILKPNNEYLDDGSRTYNLSLMFPENCLIIPTSKIKFQLLEGPHKFIGEGEIID